MATMLPRTLLALCLFLGACKREKTPTTPAESAERCSALIARGDALRDKQEYGDAVAAYEQALALCYKGPYSIRWRLTAKSAAETYTKLGENKKAAALYREILDQDDKDFGKDSPESFMATDSLVRALWFKASANEAEALLLRMVAIREEALAKNRAQEARSGSDSGFLASSLKNLAAFEENFKSTEAAEPHFRRALQVEIDCQLKTNRTSSSLDSTKDSYRRVLLKMGDTEQQAQEKIDKMMEPLSKK